MRKIISILACLAILINLVLDTGISFAQEKVAPGGLYNLSDYQKLTGKKITKFSEAPQLAELVKQGKLPPVEKRLPKEPVVVEPYEKIGRYGGTWEEPIGKVGQTNHMTTYPYDGLVTWDAEGKRLIPNIAKSWRVLNGGKVWEFKLREGMKWSDGAPFTADDIVFWYEDIVLNKDLTPVSPIYLTIENQVGRVEKVDDYTVRFIFPLPKANLLEQMLDIPAYLTPKHYLKQFHPKYVPIEKLNEMAKKEGLDQWYQLFGRKNALYENTNPDLPTLKPWVPRTESPATRYIYERNPYYWKIDPAGNQLPYIDRVAQTLVEGTEMVNMKAMMGEATLVEWGLTLSNYTLFMENREKGNYRVLLWPKDEISNVTLFINQNYKDPVLKKLFRDRRFRQALSLAINREEVNKFCYLGLGVPRQATVLSTSPYFKEEYAKAYAEYNPNKANELLDQLGLTRRDKEGSRLRSDGKPLELIIETPGENPTEVDVLELVSKYWRNIGIKVAVKPSERTLYRMRMLTGEAQIGTWFLMGGQEPTLEPHWYIPTTTQTYWAPMWGQWYQAGGKAGENPPQDIKKLQHTWDLIQKTFDPARRRILWQQILDVHAQEVYMIGIVGEVPQPIIVKNSMHNVPQKCLHSWPVGHYLGLARVVQFYIE
ncbi:TPA: ABC transporter substrate-binding protein [bacterium]|nr:ABC transporter substrate-binding protein [bacterium]